MKKLFFSILCAFFALSSAKAALPPAGSTVYLVVNQTWLNTLNSGGYIRFHLYSSPDWRENMTLVAGTTNVYSVQMPDAYNQTNLEFELMLSSGSRLYNIYNVNSWVAGQNCYTINSSVTSGNAPTSGTYGIYTPTVITDPTVTLTVSATVSVGNSVELLSETLNFTCEPNVEYSVKVPGSDNFVPTGTSYTFTECGVYEFKAVASCDAEEDENVKTVTAIIPRSEVDIVYFKPNSAWQASDAVFQLHFYGGTCTPEPRIMMTLVSGTGAGTNEAPVYQADISGITCNDFEIIRFRG